jgi:hypothetical protein
MTRIMGWLMLPAILVAAAGCGSSQPTPDPVGAPILTSVEPRVASLNVGVTLVIEGKGLGGPSQTESTAPTLTVFRSHDLEGRPVSGPSDSGLVPVDVVGGIERIELRDFVFLEGAPYGLWSFRLTTRAGLEATFPDAIALLPPPKFTGLDYEAYCALETAPPLGITGQDFLVLDGRAPTLFWDNAVPTWDPSYSRVTLSPTPSGCSRVPFDRVEVQRCTRLVAPAVVPDRKGNHLLHVSQPAPLEQAGEDYWPVYLDLPLQLGWICPPFVVVDESSTEVQLIDYNDPVAIKAGIPPTVTIDGLPAVARVDNCTPSMGTLETCTALWVTVPQGLNGGSHEIAVTSMPGCRATLGLQVAGRPVVSTVAPTVACSRSATLTVSGSEFYSPRVFLGDIELAVIQDFPPTSSGCPSPRNVIRATVGPVPVSPGSYLLTVESSTTPPLRSAGGVPVSVVPGPPVTGGPVPETIYGGIETSIWVPLLEPVTTVTGVALIDWARTGRFPVPYSMSSGGVAFVVPAGTPRDTYMVEVTEGGLCAGTDTGHPLYVLSSFVVRAETFDADADSVYVVDDDAIRSRHPVVWQASGGNPGGAVSYGPSGSGSTWYFNVIDWTRGQDLGVLRFDLRRASGGVDFTAPDVVLLMEGTARLEYRLAVPPGTSWTHHEVRLDDPSGWTIGDSAGNRPATEWDLHAAAGPLWIRGMYGSGGSETWLDNLTIELRH